MALIKDMHPDTLAARRTQMPDQILATLLGVTAGAICIIGAWIPSFWYDEAASVSGANRSLRELWHMMHNIDAVHGIYYAGLHLWTEVFGSSELAVRTPSAIAVAITTIGVWNFGRELIDRSFATLSALIFMILPRTTWMGAEARSFAIVTALVVWSSVLLLRLTKKTIASAWWLLYAILVGTAMACHLFAALMAPVHLIILLAYWQNGSRRQQSLYWIGAWIVGTLLASPIIRIALDETGQLPHGSQTVNTWLNQLATTQFFAGALPTYARLAPWPPGPQLWSYSLTALAFTGWALAILGSVMLWRVDWKPWCIVMAWLILPFAALAGYAFIGSSMYAPRYFCYVVPAMAMLIAAALRSITKVWRSALIAVLVVTTLPIYLSQRTESAKQDASYRPNAQYVAANAMHGDAVYITPGANPMLAAYPEYFSTLSKPAMQKTAAEANALFDQFKRFDSKIKIPQEITSLWLVECRSQAKDDATADAAISRLRELGFVEVDRHDGSLESVSRWVRR